ncbi:MAG: hypothetical protein KIC92_09785 [Clostridiales bacterium]|nr:hypothetical protein [Clostridiales bacterium]
MLILRLTILSIYQEKILKEFFIIKSREFDSKATKKFFKLLDSTYRHMDFIMKVKKYNYQKFNEYMVYEIPKRNKMNIAKIHLRSTPIESIRKKFKLKDSVNDLTIGCFELLNNNTTIKSVQLITHNRILSEKIINKIIIPYMDKYNLVIKVEEISNPKYLAWMICESYIINKNLNFTEEENLNYLKKIDSIVNLIVSKKN